MPDDVEAWFAAPGIDRHLVPTGATTMLGYGLMPYRPGRPGKSCIRCTSLDRIDTGGPTTLVRDAVAATAAGENAQSAG